MSGLGSNAAAKEAIKVGIDYFKANTSRISASIKAGDHDYHLHLFRRAGQGGPAADGGPGEHEPGRQHRAGGEPG
jgi:ATP-dependent Lon protease